MPDEISVELIDGGFYLSAPGMRHQYIASELHFAFMYYIKQHGGKCSVSESPNVRLDADVKTIVKPDLAILCDSKKSEEQAIVGAPDLVIEILSPSTEKIDKGLKYTKYKNAGVKEYWIIDLTKETVSVFDFANGVPMMLYGLTDKVPVGIYLGECLIDFMEIMEAMREYSD